MRGEIGTEAHVIPFSARVSLQRSSYTIAHRALEPSGQQKLAGINGPVVSPDGRAIAFTAMGDLWLLPAGQPPVQLTNDAAMDIDPAWSPDSTRIAFASDRGGKMDLWLRDLRDNSLSQLTKERGRVSGPAWSPDGNHIAFLIDHRTLAAVDLRRDVHRYAFDTSAHGELGGRRGRMTASPSRWAHCCDRTATRGIEPVASDPPTAARSHRRISPNIRRQSSGHGPVWSPDGFVRRLSLKARCGSSL
jgi:WD40 repeat protein